MPILVWNALLISPLFLKRSLVFPILLFSCIFFFNCSFKKAFLSLFSMKWDFMEQQNTRQLFKCTFWKILVIYYYLNGNLFILNAAVAAKLLQSCPTLGDHIDSSPQSSSVPGILQARILEWVAISFSNEWKRKMKVKLLTRVQLFATPWTVAYQTPPSMGFSRQEYWSGLTFPSPSFLMQIF